MKIYNFFCAIIIALSCSQASLAGNLQTINSLALTDGNAFGNPNQKEAFNNFTEYPLSKKASVGGTMQLTHINSDYHNNTQRYALNSTEIFHRYKILSFDKLGVTMQNTYKFSGVFNDNKNLALQPAQDDYELRFLFAHNMPDRLVNTVVHGGTPYFARAEIAYRQRFSNPFNEIRFAFWGGVNLSSKFMLLAQDNIAWNVQSKATSASTNSPYTNIQPSKSANNIATLSLIYRCDKDMAIQFGYIDRIAGNAPFYDGRGVIIGLWNSF